jgi:hypothetical protein
VAESEAGHVSDLAPTDAPGFVPQSDEATAFPSLAVCHLGAYVSASPSGKGQNQPRQADMASSFNALSIILKSERQLKGVVQVPSALLLRKRRLRRIWAVL